MIEKKPARYRLHLLAPPQVSPHLGGWLGNLRASSRPGYVRDLNHFAAFVGKHLHNITRDDLRDYRDYLIETYGVDGNRTYVVDRKLNVIKSLFTYLSDEGILSANLGRSLKLRGVPTRKGPARVLAFAEVACMIGTERDPRNRAILLLFYKGGLRASELRSLDGRHVTAHERGCTVGPFVLKGGAEHTLLLSPDVALALSTQIAGPNEPIFRARRSGSRLTTQSLVAIVARSARRVPTLVGVNVSPHWLRHAAATHASRHGAPFPIVQRDLGHARPETTMEYIDADPNDGISFYLPKF